MSLSFMQNEIVLALGWTLIHSLWQGLLLAALTGAMLVATRRSDARRRYEMLTGLFLLFLGVTGITFERELYLALYHPAISVPAHPLPGRHLINSFLPLNNRVVRLNRSLAERFKTYFSAHAYVIVLVWFIIFMFRFVKLIAELAYVQRLKHYRTQEPAAEWKEKMGELMEKLSMHRYIQLLESAMVKVPVVMGIFKPVILLPLGLLSQLPMDEIEAILLHELAHIRRRDYFVNLCQSFAETIFFFNPALLWLSSLIREERENCCDDIAISVTQNKTKFIDALISFQEFDLAVPAQGVGFPGAKNQLLNRVKRIISKNNKTLNTTEKSILTLGMAILIMCSFVAAKRIPLTGIRKKIVPISLGICQKENNGFPSLFRQKAETVNPFPEIWGYSPSARLIDTTLDPNGMYNPSLFKSHTITVPYDDKNLTVIIRALNWQGSEYKLTKTNDVFIEFAVDNAVIDGPHLSNYRHITDALEALYRNKREIIVLFAERGRLMHESDLAEKAKSMQELEHDRQEIEELNKRINVARDTSRPIHSRRAILIDNIWTIVPEGMSDSLFLLLRSLKNKQKEIDWRLALLDSITNEDRRKQMEINSKPSGISHEPAEFTDQMLVPDHILLLNSTWRIKKIEDYPNNAIRIYRRNATLVKTLENYKNDWNGSDETGIKLPAAEYYYTINLDKHSTTSVIIKGFLTIENGK